MEIVFVLHFLYMHAHEQLTGTQFSKVVCPLFQHYSRFNLTLQSLSEDNSRLTNISLITFLTKKLAKTSCNYVSFTHYSVNCISSKKMNAFIKSYYQHMYYNTGEGKLY